MKIKEYPKTLVAYINTSTVNGWDRRERYKEVVYNQTAYNSFIKKWEEKHFIDERPPKWKELKGSFIKKLWYKTPTPIVVVVSYLFGLATPILADLMQLLYRVLRQWLHI